MIYQTIHQYQKQSFQQIEEVSSVKKPLRQITIFFYLKRLIFFIKEKEKNH